MNANKGVSAAMDFRKKIIIYGSIIAALAALFVIGAVVQAAGLQPKGEKLFPALKTSEIEKIAVTDKAGTVEIVKKGGAWSVLAGGKVYDGESTAAEGLLENFSNLRRRDVVTSNKDNWPGFSLDEANAVHIVLSGAGGAPAADCWFGKGGATSFSQYVRRQGGPEVILTDYRIEKSTVLKEWVRLRLFGADFAAADVAGVELATGLAFNPNGEAVRLSRPMAYTLLPGEKDKDGVVTWTLKGEKVPLAAGTVNAHIGALARFSADDIVADPEKLTLDPAKPAGILIVTLKTGPAYSLKLLGKSAADPNVFYVSNQDGRFIYTASNWRLKEAFKTPDEFVDAKEVLKQLQGGDK